MWSLQLKPKLRYATHSSQRERKFVFKLLKTQLKKSFRVGSSSKSSPISIQSFCNKVSIAKVVSFLDYKWINLVIIAVKCIKLLQLCSFYLILLTFCPFLLLAAVIRTHLFIIQFQPACNYTYPNVSIIIT